MSSVHARRATSVRASRRPRRHGPRPLALAALLLGAVTVGAGDARAQAGPEPDVRTLLARAEAVYDRLGSLRARFEQTIEIPLLGRKRSGHGEWLQKGRGRFKMEFAEPAGDLIVADGTHLWLYYPSTHPGQVIRSRIDASPTGAGMVDLQGRIFDEAAAKYDAVLDGRADVHGHPTWEVTLTPRGESPYRRVKVWIDTQSLLVRRFEIVEQNETVRTVVLDDLQPDARIPDDAFRFRPPPDADVFEG